LIEILQIFLEEIRDMGNFNLPRCVIGSFSEIHVILQKILFLLHDLTRRDARVWMLINSGRVAGHFRALLGAMAAALDGVVLEAGYVGDEVRDYVEHLIKQGKRGSFEEESDDIRGLNLIDFLLDQMEKKVIPGPSNLKRVMVYLGIQNWSDCNEQVEFLEDEFGSDPGVSSILGLMVYCRCVLFHGSSVDGGLDLGSMRSTQMRYTGYLNPDEFKCPISLEIMVDPVTISSGQTYDRCSILKWFKLGNLVCPKTGQKLESLDLVPNLALKRVIKSYCLETGINLPISKSEAKHKSMKTSSYVLSVAAEESMRMAADFLSIKLAMGTVAEKSKAAYEIRLLTKRSEFNRECCVEAGAIPYLLNLLLCKDSTAQENSIAALLNLSKHSQSKAAIVNNGGLALVVRVLKCGIKMEARQYAAATLFYLSLVEDYRTLIGNNPDAIPSLVQLIRVGGGRGKKSALVAIFGLLLVPSHHYRVLEAGLVPLLVKLLGTTESKDLVADSLAVLAALAERSDGARAILHANALNVIMGMLCSSSYESSRLEREHCVSLLLALCINCGGEVIEVLTKSTSLMGALYSVLTEGTSRATKKASSLIRLLHEFSERSSSRSMPCALPHENFIHVW